MKYSSAILIAAYAATTVYGHGLVTAVNGANGKTLPGLSLIDGTPRDSPSPASGAEADTSIIRTNELGTSKASALGRNSKGPVDAAKMVTLFMNGAAANSSATVAAREAHALSRAKFAVVERQASGGTKTPAGTKETSVQAATGAAVDGLPTTDDQGNLKLTYHQVNQDGAGPLVAMIDSTSGGQDPAAFKTATVSTNVPGVALGLSAAQTMEFPVEIQMPAGTVCGGSVGGATNACIARLNNNTPAGPFGGSVIFTQSPAAKKRAIEYNLRKRRMARGLPAEEQ